MPIDHSIYVLPLPSLAQGSRVRPVASRVIEPSEIPPAEAAEGPVHFLNVINMADGSLMEQAILKTLVSNRQSPFVRLFRRLKGLKQLGPDWNSYGASPPNSVAIFRAYRILQELLHDNYPPQAVKPSPDEGVAIVFVSEKGNSSFQCLNNGNVLMMISRPNVEPIIRPLNSHTHAIQNAIVEIQAALG